MCDPFWRREIVAYQARRGREGRVRSIAAGRSRLPTTKDEAVVRTPNVLWPGAVTAEPKHAADATEIEALGGFVVCRERRGGNRNRAGRCPVLRRGLSALPLRLIE